MMLLVVCTIIVGGMRWMSLFVVIYSTSPNFRFPPPLPAPPLPNMGMDP